MHAPSCTTSVRAVSRAAASLSLLLTLAGCGLKGPLYLPPPPPPDAALTTPPPASATPSTAAPALQGEPATPTAVPVQ